MTATGCFFNFLKVSAAMCCALDIIPLGGRVDLDGTRTENLFRAIELSVPSVIAHLRVVHRDENNKVLDSREYNFDLNSGGDCPQHKVTIMARSFTLNYFLGTREMLLHIGYRLV